MKNLVTLELTNTLNFNSFVNEELLEAHITDHYAEQFELRIGGLKVTKTAGLGEKEIEARTKILLDHLNKKLSRFPLTKEKNNTIIDFGDIVLESKEQTYKPVFSIPKDEAGERRYEGSVFCATASIQGVTTFKLFDRDSTSEDKKQESIDHVRREAEKHPEKYPHGIEEYASFNHVYLDKKVNVINMDIPTEEFAASLEDDGLPHYRHIEKQSKEMVLSKGTRMKFISKIDGTLKEKVIVRTERQRVPGREELLVIYFEDNSRKTFKEGDSFIVTPSKETSRDIQVKKRLEAEGSNYSGNIYMIGTYDRKPGDKKDYVRIMATEVF